MWGKAIQLCGCCLLGTSLLWADESRQVLSDPFLFTGSRLRGAFQEVIAQPRQWIVEVQNGDGKRVALGVVVGAEGEILTKASELEGSLSCRLTDGRTLPATLVSTEETNDLALLKIDASGLAAAVWDDQQTLAEGQFVVTPGLGETPVAVGVLGALPHHIPRSVRGVLGIRMEPAGPATIAEVFGEGGAASAGLLKGDVLLEINAEAMANSAQVVEMVRRFRPGEKIRLKIQRGEETQNLEATLTHPFGDLLSRIAMQNQLGGELSDRRDDFPSALQHDAVLTPRDCGGCIVNLDGRAVGLNIARAGRTETYALPVDVVLKSLEVLRKSPVAAE